MADSPNSTPSASFPAGIANAFRFQFFNGLSFSIIIGAPALLFFKNMGASATVLGIVVALPPLLNLMQIPAAYFVEQVGYRRFVLRGWMARSVFILAVAGVAFLPESVDVLTRIVLALFLLFCFNLIRGISVCGFLPWISQLIPASLRAQYFSKDQIWCNVAVLATGIGAAFFLRVNDSYGAFGALFLVSFLGALASLFFLSRIPDVPVPADAAARSREKVPRRALFRHQPFRRQLIYNTALLLAWGGGGVVFLPMARDQFQVSDSNFMFIMASATGAHILGCLWFGKVIDRVGSKPALILSWSVQLIHFSGWMLVSAGVLPFSLPVIAFQQLTWGCVASLYMISNMRMLMANVPDMGRSHFFAIHSVCTSLALGLSPVIWGIGLDGLILVLGTAPEGPLTPYVGIYLLVLVTTLAASGWLFRLHEPEALTTRDFIKHAFAGIPARALPWLFRRRNSPGMN